MSEVGLPHIIGILVTMLFSAFFSGMEIAFVSSNRMQAEVDKERLGLALVLVDVLHNRPGDGYAVVGARAAPQLVEEYQTALGEVIEDRRGFVHLHHERGLT